MFVTEAKIILNFTRRNTEKSQIFGFVRIHRFFLNKFPDSHRSAQRDFGNREAIRYWVFALKMGYYV